MDEMRSGFPDRNINYRPWTRRENRPTEQPTPEDSSSSDRSGDAGIKSSENQDLPGPGTPCFRPRPWQRTTPLTSHASFSVSHASFLQVLIRTFAPGCVFPGRRPINGDPAPPYPEISRQSRIQPPPPPSCASAQALIPTFPSTLGILLTKSLFVVVAVSRSADKRPRRDQRNL